MDKEKKNLVTNINHLIQDLLMTRKTGQIKFFEKLKDEIQSANLEKFQQLMVQISTMAPLAQYAGFSLEEERKLHVVIDSAIDYLHRIGGM